MASDVADCLFMTETGVANLQKIDEGNEPIEFWAALGGQSDYDTELDAPGAPFLDPRLFDCLISAKGKISFQKIDDFNQSHLSTDDIMLLDGGDEVYIWQGTSTTQEEKNKSNEFAYVRYTASYFNSVCEIMNFLSSRPTFVLNLRNGQNIRFRL